jgi:hypothetical protein
MSCLYTQVFLPSGIYIVHMSDKVFFYTSGLLEYHGNWKRQTKHERLISMEVHHASSYRSKHKLDLMCPEIEHFHAVVLYNINNLSTKHGRLDIYTHISSTCFIPWLIRNWCVPKLPQGKVKMKQNLLRLKW